ncbi:MAG: hypothetical protein WBW33_30150 [Bryobacteraceae bacterium]
MREQNLLRRHIDLLAVAGVLLGYFVFSGVQTCVLTPSGAAARIRLERKMHPVHVDSRQFRWMRMAKAFRIQLV